ncbi:MAG: TIGR04222 domain-containing membrane protein [Micropruina sp.]|uniref:TIGR04222 domain-containing membrane protein n=1 Tax=Micropruina sp. TaxID=2737536 RepID=UPI0039E266F3
MTASLWATVAVSIAGVCVALAIWFASRQPRPDDARREIEQGLELVDIALISGGPARAVDSQIVDLVERGLLRADGGWLRVSGTPVPDGRYADAVTVHTVEIAGDVRLETLREQAGPFRHFLAVLRLTRRRLIISPDRVAGAPAMVWAPTMAALFLCTMGMLVNDGNRSHGLPAWAPAAISIGAWVVVPLLQLAIWCRQPGYHGKDPRSRLGRDVIDELTARIGPSTSQAFRVATGGFAAMTDDALRQAIMGTASDSEWDARPWRKRVFQQNAENRYVWSV